ncbi:ER to golgi family vesicle transport protein [Trypanosoma rangeli]|uniref:ER to golgi family vesicle transport protein n=1 Tax=Trypanosoma rangeli TaxID=5698 RepID=A0A422N6D9_TRYRA|nr:ER to golgi family vesicle transport protein [Trypanosoma rangeli]RNF01025.1 ER to golgi family vesicle transport protein [Trypanosoma rangeli]|eukprot:RNF01025.1 ER to golgi family vesicle transport protein [Trypanosoma rangeli]
MGSVGANWRTTLQDDIGASEAALQRLRGRQTNRETARKQLLSAFNVPYVSSLDVPPHLPSPQGELADKVNCIQSQVKNFLTELETERTVRSDGVRELQRHVSIQVGELKAMFQQLKKENEYLTDTVRVLERRVTSNAATAPRGRVDVFVDADISGAAANPASAGLVKRVEELESTVTQQRRLLEDRQTRLDGVLREMVGVRVDSGMERVRSVARDVARDSVEDVLRLRLAAVQNMFNGELQKVMQTSGVTAEVANATERLFHQLEKDLLRRVQEIDAAVNAVSHNSRQHEAVLNDVERRIMQKVAVLEREVEASRRETRDGIAQNAQAGEERTAAIQLAFESAVAERITVACQSAAKKEDIVAAVTALEERLEQQCAAVRDGLTAAMRTHDTVAEVHHKRVTRLEERLNGIQDATEEVQRQIAHVDQLVTGATREAEKCRQRVREALTTSEEARAVASDFSICVQKAEDAAREGLARTGVELQRLTQEQERSAAQVRQLGEKLIAAEAHQAAMRVVLDELRGACTNTVPLLTARLDAVHRTVQEVCIPKLEETAQAVAEVQTRQEQLQANASSLAKTDARQLSDLRRELSSGMQSVEERVLQAVRETQQESSMAVSRLRTFVDGIKASVKAQDERFVTESALDTISGELTERVLALEDKVDVVVRQVREEAKTLPSSTSLASVPAVTASPHGEIEREVGNLRRLVEDTRRNAASQLVDMEQQIRASMQEEVEGVKQLLHRLREDSLSQMQKLRAMLSEEAGDQSRRIEEAAQRETQRLRTQIDRLREALGPRSLVSALRDDEELLSEVAEALRCVFAQSSDTTEAIASVKKRIQHVEQSLGELDVRCYAHTHESAQRMQKYESSQCHHADRLTLLESKEETVVEMGKRWREEVCKDCKRELELFSMQFDERAAALQGASAELELQTRSMLFALRELKEEQAALRQEVAATADAQQQPVVRPTDTAKDDEGEDKDNDDEVWRLQITERMEVLESKTDGTACSTADAFETLRESIEQCVTLFVREAAATALLQESNVSAAELTGLDGVLLFLLEQLCQLHDGVQALQSGALETLELVQHHEEQFALLPFLRSLAVCSARDIKRLSEAMGLSLDLHVDSPLAEHEEGELELEEEEAEDKR